MDDGNQNTGIGSPLKQFVRIEPADTCDAINVLIVELNNLFTSGGIIPGSTVTQKQFRAWAAANGSPVYIYTIDQAVSADIADNVNIRWNHGNTMAINDALYNFIQSTLSFSNAQMLAAFAAMGTFPS